MRRRTIIVLAAATLAAAAAVIIVLLAATGEPSIDDLASERFHEGASCRKAGLTQSRAVYSCQTGAGTTACVVRDGNDLFLVDGRTLGIAC